jgi:hypothetical protein
MKTLFRAGTVPLSNHQSVSSMYLFPLLQRADAVRVGTHQATHVRPYELLEAGNAHPQDHPG